MLRTVEWCRIGGFDEWFERFAIESRKDVVQGEVEPLPGSYWLFALCRSNYARRLMGATLERVVDILELPSSFGPHQWVVMNPLDPAHHERAVHLGCASHTIAVSGYVVDSSCFLVGAATLSCPVFGRHCSQRVSQVYSVLSASTPPPCRTVGSPRRAETGD